MNDNLSIWDKVARPPADALKRISGGRLSGMTDISPQWRIKIMTEQFGPIGVGWDYSIDRLWTEPGSDGQVCAFAQVLVRYKRDEEHWSSAIPGIGGSMLIANETKGPYTSDEAYKMAVTDALSVALKTLGVAADIYMGLWDGSKYKTAVVDEPTLLGQCTTLEQLKTKYERVYKTLTTDEERDTLRDAKDKRKQELTEQATVEAKMDEMDAELSEAGL